ncbi:MAG TPA: RluA family pseudouridine synthase [Verrucomicrobiae bacterium]|nr:RluA family pseudouridine synthase [Verrucomicrobiae bacterium]
MEPVPEKRTLVADMPAPRLDAWLVGRCPDLSRARLQKLIKGGHVCLGGAPAKPSTRVRTGDLVKIEIPAPAPSDVRPEEIPLDIIFEDDALLAINKPAGLVAHPAPGHPSGTLVNALLHHCRGRLSGIGGVERPGIVHRLDKDTSGIMLVAKTDAAHRSLARQLAQREMSKTYLALIAGEPPAASGRIEQPIARHPVDRQRMAVVANGRHAVTLYRLAERLGPVSLLECDILTGRTHQIRVHLQWLRCPILGDTVYGRQTPAAARQMLHAWKLAFAHPSDGHRLHLTAPLTPDFQNLLNHLRNERPHR